MNKKNTSKKFSQNKRTRSRDHYRSHQSGQVIIGALLLFLTISITVLVGIATPVAIQVRSAADFLQSKQSYISADVLNEEALYRLNKGKTLPSSIVLSFNDATSTALISDVGSKKQVLATGVSGLFTRLSQSLFTQGQGGFALNYGTQVGIGGIRMEGSPTINGNVIANSDIIGSGVSTINGNVVVASVSPQVVDASNEGVYPPPSNVIFGKSASTQDFAQSFTVSTTTELSNIAVYIKKTGSPGNVNVYITTNSGSSPSSSYIAQATLNKTQVSSSYYWIPITFNTKISFTPGTTYWIVFDAGSNSSSKNYSIAMNTSSSYPGTSKSGVYGGTWSSPLSNSDAYFQIYLGDPSKISGVVVNGSAYGDIINNSTISGTLYCESGTGNNKDCNASSSTPNAITYPYSDTNISNWKTEATNGGVYNGNLTIEGVTATTTGPLKINGNLKVSASGRMSVTGTIYVTGNVVIEGVGDLSLASSYGSRSGVIVADGTVQITSSASLSGSGTTGSYITVVTTSGCGGISTTCTNPAVALSGNSDAVVVFAPNGKIKFEGSARANALIAYAIDLSGNVRVNYNSALSTISYDDSTSGGGSTSWITDTWKEISF
ncbi:MAG: hypothetical protein K9M11_03490 [Candidatus Pacebacteria bacterium]|nr:hypothetical protein [Candidatus Paceibacterota bacterium]